MIIRIVGNGRDRSLQDVTIEPNDRTYSFCKILDGRIILNKIGVIINDQWEWLFDQYDHIKMDEYIIMPNHFHCLIEIRDVGADPCVRPCIGPDGNPIPYIKPTKHTSPTLSHIIQWFKTMTTNDYIKGVKNHHWDKFNNKLWERSFTDRILRKNEIDIKREYIRNNPKNWDK